jgi:hypothetical protein
LSRKIVSESGFPKLISKAIPQSYRFSKQLSVNAAFIAAKLLPTIAPQNCSSKLLPLPKIPMLLPEAASKLVGPESCPTLLP